MSEWGSKFDLQFIEASKIVQADSSLRYTLLMAGMLCKQETTISYRFTDRLGKEVLDYTNH